MIAFVRGIVFLTRKDSVVVSHRESVMKSLFRTQRLILTEVK